MSTPPKTPPFWCLKSFKIKEKWTLKTNLKKTLKIRPGYLFLQFWPPNGSLRGGRASHFFNIFLSLGPFWAPLGSKWCQGLHYETIFLPCWVRFDAQIQKNVTSSGKQSQTSIQKLRSVFENWRVFRFVFLYIWIDFACRIQPTREWKLRGV